MFYVCTILFAPRNRIFYIDGALQMHIIIIIIIIIITYQLAHFNEYMSIYQVNVSIRILRRNHWDILFLC